MSKEQLKQVVTDFASGKITDAKAGFADVLRDKIADRTAEATGIDKTDLVPSKNPDDE